MEISIASLPDSLEWRWSRKEGWNQASSERQNERDREREKKERCVSEYSVGGLDLYIAVPIHINDVIVSLWCRIPLQGANHKTSASQWDPELAERLGHI